MIGKTIAHYRILEKLGEGGMGVVYKAQDTKLDRFVALKFLPQHLSTSEEEKKRFTHEAKAASALDHNNICTIYEIDETEDGQMFIAMACYEGESLKQKIERGPLPIEETIDIAIQVAEGLAKAHGQDIVHRDIKPANLLVTNDGVVKIVDFGLAKLAGRTKLTKEGTTLGTVAYMSPEQTQGTEVDHRTDIWALSAVLYEMVTGQTPFKGDYEQAVMYSIMNEEPEPMTGLRTGVPMELEQIVNKALAKNPQERYQNVNEVAVDLNRIIKTLGTEKTKSPVSRTQPQEHARRFRLGATAIFMMVLIVAGFYLFSKGFLTKPEKTIDSIAVLPLDNLSRDPEQAYFVDGMHEALITDLAKISALKVISRTSVMRYKQSDKAVPEIARELGVDALVEGSVLRVGDQVRITAQLIHGPTDEHIWAANYDRDLSNVLALLSEVARAIAGEIQVALTQEQEERLASTRPVNPKAHEAYLWGRYFWNKRTEEGMKKSIDYFQQALDIDPNYALSYVGLAEAYVALGFYADLAPTEAYPKAKTAAQKALEIDETSGEAHTVLAATMTWSIDRNWRTAETHFRRAVELNPSNAISHQWYGEYLMGVGRLDEALSRNAQARELDPFSLIISAARGWFLYFAREYNQAIAQLRKTLEIDPNFVVAHLWLGPVYEQRGLVDEAIATFKQALVHSSGSPKALAGLAHTYAVTGKRDEAIRILDELTDLSTRRHVSPYDVALIYVGLGEYDLAFEWLEKAYDGGASNLFYIKVEPRLDVLRSDPRFEDMLRLMNFPEPVSINQNL